jgi:excisionase family DNA binding protein
VRGVCGVSVGVGRVLVTPARPLAAPVRGFSALVIVGELRESLPTRLEGLAASGGVHPGYLRELRETWGDLCEAAEQWKAWKLAQAGDGSAEPQNVADLSCSTSMTAGEASTVLEVSSSRVRQLLRAGVLEGRRVRGRWLVDRASVEIRRTVA